MHEGPDEATQGQLRMKEKLTPRTPPLPPWDVPDIPQALLTALKVKEIVNL